jgi:hypothetical protein
MNPLRDAEVARSLANDAPENGQPTVTVQRLRRSFGTILALAICLVWSFAARAQDNFEIQVYGSDTVPKDQTMVELHSNITAEGRRIESDRLAPTNRAWHETLEITHGWNDWFETGFYIFTSVRSGDGWDFVGSHIRPRVRAPSSWSWPVGVSLSGEIGYQRRKYSVDTWSVEIRPIVDKSLGRWYLAFNPTIETAIHGENAGKSPEFSPNLKVSYDLTKQVAAGLEYYGAVGPINGFDPLSQQEQQFYPSIDLNVSPKWEFNFGVGVGATRSTDHLIVKWIIGRRFGK